jgi:hypothetical protein
MIKNQIIIILTFLLMSCSDAHNISCKNEECQYYDEGDRHHLFENYHKEASKRFILQNVGKR